MKTAMQELIEELQSINDFKYKGLVIELIKNKLEKEKEQMLNEWQKGFEDAKYIYNQNK
jgi:hypothetical protein